MKNRIFCFVMCLLLITTSARAAAPGAALGTEVGAVINQKVIARGFAANDPRFAATIAAVGAAAEVIGVGVVVAGTAPAWGTILATAAVAGAIGYGMQSLANWIFHSNGTVTVPGATAPPYSGQTWAYWNGHGYPYSDTGAMQICQAYWGGSYTVSAASFSTGCALSGVATVQQYPVITGVALSNIPDPNYVPPTTPAQTVPVSTVLSSLTPAQAATPLAAADVAEIADAAWKNAAAQPGYAGLPYLASDPVTAADVNAARAANPSMPISTVGDLAATIPTSNAVTLPNGQPALNPGTNPSTQPVTNLGNDPGIGAPTLESTPTAAQILAPLINLFPDLRSFVVPPHTGACPMPSMTLFGNVITLNMHCTLLEQVRPTLYAVMAVVWLVIALFIFLAA